MADDQPDLFGFGPHPEDEAKARSSDPPTSHDAAASVNVSRLERMVLAILAQAGRRGLTTWEIADAYEMHAGSITPRMVPLEWKGRVIRTNVTRIPPGHSKRQIVWRINEGEDEE